MERKYSGALKHGESAIVKGWVEKVRDLGGLKFFLLRGPTKTKTLRWPMVYIKTKEGKIVVAENKLAVEVMDQFPSGDELVESLHKREHIHLKEWGEVDVNVHQALQDCDVVLKLPFYDVHDDLLTDIKFGDKTEVVLTVGC